MTLHDKHGPALKSGDQVNHKVFGRGIVELDRGSTVLIRFERGFQECPRDTVSQVLTPLQAIQSGHWPSMDETVARLQALTIRSVNDMWGVFSRSRIELLPHQLWVCRRVLENWPARWLVADDVGLGKTIEAGLILMPLLARRRVKRLLILTPASLVEQWQHRMRTMFDIRLARYMPEADTPRADFWGTQSYVVASLETLRADHRGRHQRLLDSDPWDLLLVDEAHRLNADEQSGPTLGYKLVHAMTEADRVESMVFFTGTPHRGKDFGFLSLLRLLRPDLFDSRTALSSQLPLLREVMIRNNKQDVTDLEGRKLFQQPKVSASTYTYSPEETRFYDMLTEFISTGRAYASSLTNRTNQRAVMLVLIAMQKLASSSVAAIRKAIERRLERLNLNPSQLSNAEPTLTLSYDQAEEEGDTDALAVLEEEVAGEAIDVRLMEDEARELRSLLDAAVQIKSETKISTLIEGLKNRMAGRSVLFFTEYKATQALLMSALHHTFGDGCVAFINGDERIDGVLDAKGAIRSYKANREEAAGKFNSGQVRFLVSTEAGGEGIDLQEKCHTLVHVDLPWNPMRMHQRVGRLNRYGQRQQVEVVTIRNPDTVESRIWALLNRKIERINAALANVMDRPEDMLELVLGMTSPSLYREVFSSADEVPRESLEKWFDQKTSRFGGQDAVETVRALVGNCARFDFHSVSSQLPQVDLPDLRTFFVQMLNINRRIVRVGDDGSVTFKTPEAWLKDVAVRTTYDGMVFHRHAAHAKEASRVLGLGHKVMDAAIEQAMELTASVARVPASRFAGPVLVFQVNDRVTEREGTVNFQIRGVELNPEGLEPRVLLKDWQLLQRLNTLADARAPRDGDLPLRLDSAAMQIAAEQAGQVVLQQIRVDVPAFRFPQVELVGVLWPSKDA